MSPGDPKEAFDSFWQPRFAYAVVKYPPYLNFTLRKNVTSQPVYAAQVVGI